VREQFEKLAAGSGILNLHRIMAHAPALMKASGDMTQAFRRDTVLARSLAELAILRAAQVIDCNYVWIRHLPLARECGVTERQLDELQHWPDSAAFTPAQKAALGFAEKIAQRMPVEDGAFLELRRDFSPREIVELTMFMYRPQSSLTLWRFPTRRREPHRRRALSPRRRIIVSGRPHP
jgi:alkylhydroperoxidase family enzyme